MYRLDLVSTLQKEGHSGIIEGNCRVHFLGDFLSTKEYFENENADKVVDVTFSFGTEALGRFKFQGIQFAPTFVSGYLDLKHLDTKDEVLIEIDTEIDGMANFSRFKAVLYKNGRSTSQEDLDFLNRPISSFDLSTRALTALRVAEIVTFGNLISFPIKKLSDFRNFGKRTMTELEEFVKKHGYSLNYQKK